MRFGWQFFAKISSFTAIFLLFTSNANARVYGEKFCNTPGFHCIKVKGVVKNGVALKSETWESLWPDSRERDIVKKLNRLHNWLFPGTTLAVPDDMNGKTHMDFSPFPKRLEDFSARVLNLLGAVPMPYYIESLGVSYKPIPQLKEKLYIFNPALLAWAVYDASDKLINWGPGLGGKDYCPDIDKKCRTPSGIFEAMAKHGYNYRSNLYPPGCTGEECSWMPYAIKVREDGLSMHGAKWFIGHHASHGCVRLFTADAKWLNQKFVDIKTKEKNGTKVIFLPYPK